MKLTKLLLGFVAVFIGLIAQPSLAATKWQRADTHNFIIYSSGNREKLERFAENVERFDSLLRLYSGVAQEQRANRLTIYLLNDAGDVAHLIGDKRGMAAGVYIAHREGSFAVSNRANVQSGYDLTADTVLLHEYAHHFMFHYFNAPYPPWYVEGFAEYVSTAKFKRDGNWTMGEPANHRAMELIYGDSPPIEKLLFVEEGKPFPVYYGRSWLLVHMLNSDPAWNGKLPAFLKAITGGMPHREAAAKHFGDLKALDKALDRYLSNENFQAQRSLKPIAFTGTVNISQLDPLTSQLLELDLHRRVNKDQAKSRNALAEFTAQNPGSAEAWYQLGMAELQLGEPEPDVPEDKAKPEKLPGDAARDDAAQKAAAAVAMTAADRALAADPDHVRANVLKARLLIEQLREKGDSTVAAWRDARKYIIKANAKANFDPLPLTIWHESFIAQGKPPIKTASDGLAMAYNLAPEVNEYRINYAMDLARMGKFDEAVRLIEVLAFSPHRSEKGKEALEKIKSMQQAK